MHACSKVRHKLSFLRFNERYDQLELKDISDTFFWLFLRSVLKFHDVRTALMRTFDLYFFSDGPLLSRMFGWRSATLVNRTRRLGRKPFGPSQEIVTESGGSTSCYTQPNCCTLFTIVTALLSPSFFSLLSGCSSTFQCGNTQSMPNLHPVSVL